MMIQVLFVYGRRVVLCLVHRWHASLRARHPCFKSQPLIATNLRETRATQEHDLHDLVHRWPVFGRRSVLQS